MPWDALRKGVETIMRAHQMSAGGLFALLVVVGACQASNNDPPKTPPPASSAASEAAATSTAAASGVSVASTATAASSAEAVKPVKARPTAADVRAAYAEIFANPFDRDKKFGPFVKKVGPPDEAKGDHNSKKGGEWIWYALDENGDCRQLLLKFGDIGDVGLHEAGSMSGAFNAKCKQ